MSKQDRTYTRTAAELEQKHGFGKRFSEMLGLIDDTRDKVDSVEGNVATIKRIVDGEVARIDLLVEYDSEGKPKASGSFIIEAINGESSAKIEADRLDIEGKQLNIKVDAANITGTLTVTEADGDVLLSAGEGKVQIGSWNVDNNSLWTGTSFSASDSIFLSTGSNGNLSIAGSPEQSNWVIKAGQNFGVNKAGEVYCSKAYIQRGCVIGEDITKAEGIQLGSVYDEDGFTIKTELRSYEAITELPSGEVSRTKGVEIQAHEKSGNEEYVGLIGPTNYGSTMALEKITYYPNGEVDTYDVISRVAVGRYSAAIEFGDLYFRITESGIYYGQLLGEEHVLFEAS